MADMKPTIVLIKISTREDLINYKALDTSEAIYHAKDLLFNSWTDKVFIIICPKSISDRILLQPYLDLKIIVLK